MTNENEEIIPKNEELFPENEEITPGNEKAVHEEKEESPQAKERIYAGFFVRLTAYLIDKIIVAVPLGLVRVILWMSRIGSSSHFLTGKVFFSFTLTDLILYVLSVSYFIFLTWAGGRTIGKRLMRIKVVSAFDRRPTFFEIFFRETFGRYLSAVILYIGYLIIGAGDEKQALHDYLADTRVIYAEPGE